MYTCVVHSDGYSPTQCGGSSLLTALCSYLPLLPVLWEMSVAIGGENSPAACEDGLGGGGDGLGVVETDLGWWRRTGGWWSGKKFSHIHSDI